MTTRTVTVTGQGSTSIAPDSAVVRVSAGGRARGVADAMAACSSAADLVGEVARRHTEAPRVRSTGINLWPRHDNQGQQRGFDARHSMEIGCADIDAAGALLTELAQTVGDALSVDGVSLEVSDPSVARSVAVDAAFADARRQAEQLADLAGATLGEVLSIGGSGGGGGSAPYAEQAMLRSAKLEPGETSVGASLVVTFALTS